MMSCHVPINEIKSIKVSHTRLHGNKDCDTCYVDNNSFIINAKNRQKTFLVNSNMRKNKYTSFIQFPIARTQDTLHYQKLVALLVEINEEILVK